MFSAHAIRPLSPLHADASTAPAAVLWLPQLSLSACVRAVLSRDTRGLDLSEMERYSYLPASPTCAINFRLDGELDLLDFASPARAGSARRRLTGRLFFVGPHSQPSIVHQPGAAHFLMLPFLPDALALLTGIEPADYVNRVVDAAEVLSPEWLAWCEEVLNAADDAARVKVIAGFLSAQWRMRRPNAAAVHWLEDWSRGLAVRAGASGLGSSLRQVERRIKRWTGQSMRELRLVTRVERAFFEALGAELDESPLSLAALAAEAGFADQSHFCRQVRRVTGLSPTEFRRRVAEDEGFWIYRLWRLFEADPGRQNARGTADADEGAVAVVRGVSEVG